MNKMLTPHLKNALKGLSLTTSIRVVVSSAVAKLQRPECLDSHGSCSFAEAGRATGWRSLRIDGIESLALNRHY